MKMNLKATTGAFLVAAALSMAGAGLATAAPVAGTGVNATTSGATSLLIDLSPSVAADEGIDSFAGYAIRLQKVRGVSPKDADSLEKLRRTPVREIEEKFGFEKFFDYVVGDDNKVETGELPEGIYLVTSQATDQGKEVAPFLVAIPFHGQLDADEVPGVIVVKTRSETPPSTPDNPPTTPETPATPTSPVPPDTVTSTTPVPPDDFTEPPAPGPDSSSPGGSLAVTGAQLIGLLVAGALFVFFGLGLLLRNARKTASDHK